MLLEELSWLYGLVHVVSFVGISLRVIMLRPVPGVALAWILLVALVPILGTVLYLLIGERRVCTTRAERLGDLRTTISEWTENMSQQPTAEVDWARHPPEALEMNRLTLRKLGIPTLVGASLELVSDTEQILRRLIDDVDAAASTVHMAFYIWHPGGTADEVVDAVIRATRRGVRCRILVDSVGSKTWLETEHPGRLRQAGVEVVASLPVGPFRTITSRNDLRLHRKIVAIDGELAWTGSMNLVDPRHFKESAGVGQWVDAMARITGPAVEPLAGIFLSDWQLETNEDPGELIASSRLRHLPTSGDSDVLVVPSGPGESKDAILQLLLLTIYAAREELVLTTPYFVPEDSMLRALRSAAFRGVDVHLIVPGNVDSLLVRYASRSYYDDLMDAGVHVHPFDAGLLHTKSITADGSIAMFGTVNLDMRSLWLNFEVTLFVFDEDFVGRLRDLQWSYIAAAREVDQDAWRGRGAAIRFVENLTRLVSPLL